MPGMFRSAGDIIFSDHPPIPGQISDVQLKQFSETSNFLQCLKPLTKDHPYFFGQIRALSNNSKITIGIAGPDIAEDATPGYWNNTVGYSYNGKCVTSHKKLANTYGEKYGIGDVFGVFVTYFGKHMSTVTFVKNGQPIATRYHYETDHDKFLPTITLENGPIDLGIMWPDAAMGKPLFSDKNMIHWIKKREVSYDMAQNLFQFNPSQDADVEESAIQSPLPLSRDFEHYEVIVKETSPTGAGPAVGIATCSPLIPTPTCEILRDYFRWMADGESNKVSVNQRIGMGIHYNPDNRDKEEFNEKDPQLVLCFVTLNASIVYVRMMLQPEGGFFPLVLLNKSAKKIIIDVESFRRVVSYENLDALYHRALDAANKVLLNDSLKRSLKLDMLRKSDLLQVDVKEQDIIPDRTKQYCSVRLSREEKGIHLVQFKKPLTQDSPYFCIQINKLHEDSMMAIGIADSTFPLNKHPGKIDNSTGYVSRDGRMYYSGKYEGNLMGERYEEGDTVGLELLYYDMKCPIVLFSKNSRPVGTRFLHLSDKESFLPSVSVCGNGYDLEIDIYWQNQYLMGPRFDEIKPEMWCLPKDAEVDEVNRTIYVPDHTNPTIIQCPHPLDVDAKFDFFEIELIDEFGDKVGVPPPGIGLTSGCFQNITITSSSNFRQDFIRFLAIDEAQHAVNVGNKIGWGIIVPESEKAKKEDRLVICYLTINRNIEITRVIYEPPGGFYPVLLLLQGVNRVKLGTVQHIYSHPISEEVANQLLEDAKSLIEKERQLVAEGKDPHDLDINKQELFRTLPSVEKKSDKNNSSKMSDIVIAAKVITKKQKSVQENQKSKSCILL